MQLVRQDVLEAAVITAVLDNGAYSARTTGDAPMARAFVNPESVRAPAAAAPSSSADSPPLVSADETAPPRSRRRQKS